MIRLTTDRDRDPGNPFGDSYESLYERTTAPEPPLPRWHWRRTTVRWYSARPLDHDDSPWWRQWLDRPIDGWLP